MACLSCENRYNINCGCHSKSNEEEKKKKKKTMKDIFQIQKGKNK